MSTETWTPDPSATAEYRRFLPKFLPARWRCHQEGDDGAVFIYDGIFRLSVILSTAREDDGKAWLHVSVASPDRLPTWDQVREVKDVFIGRDRYAVMVYPPQSHYINIHPNCLHLFHCIDGHPLPEFTRGGDTL